MVVVGPRKGSVRAERGIDMTTTSTRTPHPPARGAPRAVHARHHPHHGRGTHQRAGPDGGHVRELTELLDLLSGFSSNEQRARYLLSSNWMRDHGAAAAGARLRRTRTTV